MKKSGNPRKDAGFTLIEIMIASGVVAVGMVLMMQSVISIHNHSKVTDAAVAASHFSHSILESMQEKDLTSVVQFNSDHEEFQPQEDGKIILGGLGAATVNIYAVIPSSGQGEPEYISIPVSDADLEANRFSAPNPIEIQVEILINDYQFRTSALIYTL